MSRRRPSWRRRSGCGDQRRSPCSSRGGPAARLGERITPAPSEALLGAGQGPLPPPVSLYSGPCAAPPPAVCLLEFSFLGDDCRVPTAAPMERYRVSQGPAWEGCTGRLVCRARGLGPWKCALPSSQLQDKAFRGNDRLGPEILQGGRTDAQFSPPERGAKKCADPRGEGEAAFKLSFMRLVAPLPSPRHALPWFFRSLGSFASPELLKRFVKPPLGKQKGTKFPVQASQIKMRAYTWASQLSPKPSLFSGALLAMLLPSCVI